MVILPVVACFAFLPRAQAGLSTPPDGCYPNFTTAEGCNALNFLTTGAGNSGLGWYALFSDSTGSFNTAVGAGALTLNNGDSNTAVGAAALLLNTAGTTNTAVGTDTLVFNNSGSSNTATGYFALYNNTSGSFNTASGSGALHSNNADGDTAMGFHALYTNSSGAFNSAFGSYALQSNDTGYSNTALGENTLQVNGSGYDNTAAGLNSLFSNTSGYQNTAIGSNALLANTIGYANVAVGFQASQGCSTCVDNVAIGYKALYSTDNSSSNIAIGSNALLNNTTGLTNIAVGNAAGLNLTTGYFNIDIGADGVAGEAATIRVGLQGLQTAAFIAGIRGVTTGVGDAVNVVIDSAGQLGTMSSSRRFKKEIKSMDNASESILGLKPVTFHYKNDKTNTPQFGLVAEEVSEVNPDLVVRENGEIYSVRYDAVNAMLLNEFLKEHKKVKDLETTVAQQQKRMELLTAQLKEQAAQIQKVSAEVEVNKPAPQVVVNKR